jgi:hypothetical protein
MGERQILPRQTIKILIVPQIYLKAMKEVVMGIEWTVINQSCRGYIIGGFLLMRGFMLVNVLVFHLL